MKYLFLFFAITALFADKPLVVVSVPPYAEFVQKIAGNSVLIETALPPGFDPHSGESTPNHMRAIAKAKLWIGVGEPFERRLLNKIKATNPDLVVIDLSTKTPLLGSCQGVDRHIWTSPVLAQEQAKTIARALSKIVPTNLPPLMQELSQLDTKLKELLAQSKGATIMVSHPSLSYFCKEYDLNELSVECEGKDPRPQYVSGLLEQAKARKVNCFLTQPQFNNKGVMLIAKKLGKKTYSIDPLLPNYIENMQRIAETIARCNETAN